MKMIRRAAGVVLPLVLGVALAGGTALLTASQADASVNPAQFTTVGFAGGQAFGNGWNFRYIQEKVTLPDITSGTFLAAIPGGYGASVRLQDAAQTVDLAISTTPGSGVYNAAVAVEFPNHTVGFTNGASPAVAAGDTVMIDLFYNYSGFNFTGPVGQVNYSVTDLTSPAHSFSGHFSDTGQFFNTARSGAGFTADDYAAPPSPVHVVSGNHRLVTLTDTVVTNRTGVRGSIASAPWPVQKLAVTSTGGATPLLASVPFFWGKFATSPDSTVRDGRNFSVWLPSMP